LKKRRSFILDERKSRINERKILNDMLGSLVADATFDAGTDGDDVFMSGKRLGILAGMGPRSTAPFLEMVYDECRRQYGAKYDDEYPEMVLFSWPTPFYVDRPIDDDALFGAIARGLAELEKNDVAITAMPCNTAHKYYDSLKAGAKSRLLDMVAITMKGISPDSGRATVLATKPTMEMNIYQNALLGGGKEFVFLPRWQESVLELIASIKSKESMRTIASRYIRLEKEIVAEGVDTILFACTDLSTIGEEHRSARTIDSSKELAKELVAEYLKGKTP